MAIGLHSDLSSDTISFEDFLRVYDDVHAEWVAGKVVPMSPASDRHQDVVGFLHAVIRPFLRARGLGVVRAGPFVMRLGAAAREPDLLLVRTEHTGRIKPTFLDGAADLVIEVLSPESRTRDTTEKLAEYEAAGVREYWTIDPTRQTAGQYRLGDGGRYEAVGLGEPPELASDAFPGLRIRAEWLWTDPLPDELAVLKELGVV